MLISRFFFFFKQRTAYEMRISDWSSDVCSSDLTRRPREGGGRWRLIPAPLRKTTAAPAFAGATAVIRPKPATPLARSCRAKSGPPRPANPMGVCSDALPRIERITRGAHRADDVRGAGQVDRLPQPPDMPVARPQQIGRASCRESGCKYV